MKADIDFRILPAAVNELKKAIESSDGDESVVRVMIQGGGCSGQSFGLALTPESDINPETDVVEEFDGLKVVVDKKSLLLLDGTTVEWIEEPARGFRFNAPSPRSSCGCKKGNSCNKGE